MSPGLHIFQLPYVVLFDSRFIVYALVFPFVALDLLQAKSAFTLVARFFAFGSLLLERSLVRTSR
jgi:hypothetical protein